MGIASLRGYDTRGEATLSIPWVSVLGADVGACLSRRHGGRWTGLLVDRDAPLFITLVGV